MALTTDYGMDIRIADEVGTDVVLRCCGQEMTVTGPDKYGDRTHTCPACATEVDIDDLGLVDDIR